MISMATAMVCLCLAVCQVGGSHVPVEINRTIHNLLQYYKSITKLPDKAIISGTPLFSRKPPSGKMEAKMVYMGGILETYEKLFGQMLKQLPTPSPQTTGSDGRPGPSAITPNTAITNDAETGAHRVVRRELSYILKKVQDLRKYRYQEQEKLLHGLQGLGDIQTDNVVIQNKALWELPWLYEEASSLSNTTREERRRRRRRQAQRVKTHLRG